VEYGDPQGPFCLSPVSHPCTPEASIRAAASKMAEALKLAQELLERNGVHRPEIDAVLAMYYKVGGK
jgi:mevalonate kinase